MFLYILRIPIKTGTEEFLDKLLNTGWESVDEWVCIQGAQWFRAYSCFILSVCQVRLWIPSDFNLDKSAENEWINECILPRVFFLVTVVSTQENKIETFQMFSLKNKSFGCFLPRYWSKIIGRTAALLSKSEKVPGLNEQFNMSTAAPLLKTHFKTYVGIGSSGYVVGFFFLLRHQ